mmetsp:Transcript_19909/g.29785  ORF Transcript_19909/g.29785 Transcript_19909/m.29785 type:complete len:304 (-) Transcript_19909:33-944(-)
MAARWRWAALGMALICAWEGWGRPKELREDPYNTVMVRSVPVDTKPGHLKEVLEKFGQIQDIYLPRDFHTGKPRGFGFVEFTYSEDAQRCLESLKAMKEPLKILGEEVQFHLAKRKRMRPQDFKDREEGRPLRKRDRYRDSSAPPSGRRRRFRREEGRFTRDSRRDASRPPPDRYRRDSSRRRRDREHDRGSWMPDRVDRTQNKIPTQNYADSARDNSRARIGRRNQDETPLPPTKNSREFDNRDRDASLPRSRNRRRYQDENDKGHDDDTYGRRDGVSPKGNSRRYEDEAEPSPPRRYEDEY